MSFTVSENKLEGVIFSIILILCIRFFPIALTISRYTDESAFWKVCGTLLGTLSCVWLGQMMIVPAMKSFYDHIDIDGEMMTVYQLFTKPLTINCHDWDEIHYKIHNNHGISTSIEFFYEEHYKKEKDRPVYRTGCKNYDELLLYLKKNNVELVERL